MGRNPSPTDCLASARAALDTGSWDYPIVALRTPAGFRCEKGDFPTARHVLVEGHNRLLYFKALHARGKLPGQVAEIAVSLPEGTPVELWVQDEARIGKKNGRVRLWAKKGTELKIPNNLSLLFLPPYSPELNPQENIWQFLRDNYLSTLVFDSYEAIRDRACEAWNKLTAEAGRIASIASRDWLTVNGR